MCEIQLIHKFDNKELTDTEKDNFFNMLRLGGERNTDAWGIYEPNTDILVKNQGKFSLKKLDKIMKVPTTTIFGHNRWKTKGDEKENKNNHPFKTEHFVVVHNGCISNDEELKKKYNLTYDVETDSYIIIALLEHFYKKQKNKDKLNKVIKKMAEELLGSFSVLIYHRQTKRLFYLKDYGTDFTFGLIKTSKGDVLIGTTGKNNIDKLFNKTIRGSFILKESDVVEFKPDEEMIYEIDDEEIFATMEFSEATQSYKTGKLYDYSEKKAEQPKVFCSYDAYDDDVEHYKDVACGLSNSDEDIDRLIKTDYLTYAKQQLGRKIPEILQYLKGVWGFQPNVKITTDTIGEDTEDGLLTLTANPEIVDKAREHISYIECGRDLSKKEFTEQLTTWLSDKFNDIICSIIYNNTEFKVDIWWCQQQTPYANKTEVSTKNYDSSTNIICS